MNEQANDNAIDVAREDFSLTVYSHAADLIRVYPNGTQQQLQALIEVYPRLSSVDLAHLLSDKDLAPKLEQFRQSHKSITRPTFREYAIFIVIFIVSVAVIAWGVAMLG